MTKCPLSLLFALPLIAALSACGQEPAPAPQPTQTAAPEPVKTLPAPDQAMFSELFAKACPNAEKVNTAACRRAGMGSKEVLCEYGLGKDEYLRNKATLTASDETWTIADPETVCAQH